MEKLSDFKPIKILELPGVGQLKTSGLIVLVGPNSSGKSQLLRDLYHIICGEKRKPIVATKIEIDRPEYDSLMSCLEKEGYFRSIGEDEGNDRWRPTTMYLGSGQPIAEINKSEAQQWYGSFNENYIGKRPNQFLSHFGKFMVTALFLDRRLNSLFPTNTIDFENQPPQHDLHALYLDDGARQSLLEEMIASFGRAVWPDVSRGNTMVLKVSDETNMPTAEDRLSHKKMAAFRSIEDEGDGIKSYLSTCVSILLGRRPVCLVDEPEMCLHPPQAYNLGRFIGRHAASNDTATFVATHSSHMLRGILQTTSEVQIIRLTRKNSLFKAHRVDPEQLSEALQKPTLRAESVLDGIFAQAVIVVEADGDRLVYQSTWETIREKYLIDIHFATVGGTGGIADTCKLYRTLQIPIAVIADLDVLVDNGKIRQILESLPNLKGNREELILEGEQISNDLKLIPPTLTLEQWKEAITGILDLPSNWGKGDDIKIKKQLSALANKIDRMRRLKSGGVRAFDPPMRDRVQNFINKLAIEGLFLVPVGELEEWLENLEVGVSKGNKKSWANAAAQKVQILGKQEGDVWDFLDRIGSYLKNAPMEIFTV